MDWNKIALSIIEQNYLTPDFVCHIEEDHLFIRWAYNTEDITIFFSSEDTITIIIGEEKPNAHCRYMVKKNYLCPITTEELIIQLRADLKTLFEELNERAIKNEQILREILFR